MVGLDKAIFRKFSVNKGTMGVLSVQSHQSGVLFSAVPSALQRIIRSLTRCFRVVGLEQLSVPLPCENRVVVARLSRTYWDDKGMCCENGDCVEHNVV